MQKADTPDKLFLIHTAEGNMWEMQLAQAAQQKSQNQQVKQLAQRIHQDHQQMAQELQKVIEKQGLQTPQSLSPEKQHALQVMQSQSGEDFDKCFLSAMKADHAKDVSKFEDMAKIAKDDGVKLREPATPNAPAALSTGPAGSGGLRAPERHRSLARRGAHPWLEQRFRQRHFRWHQRWLIQRRN